MKIVRYPREAGYIETHCWVDPIPPQAHIKTGLWTNFFLGLSGFQRETHKSKRDLGPGGRGKIFRFRGIALVKRSDARNMKLKSSYISRITGIPKSFPIFKPVVEVNLLNVEIFLLFIF